MSKALERKLNKRMMTVTSLEEDLKHIITPSLRKYAEHELNRFRGLVASMLAKQNYEMAEKVLKERKVLKSAPRVYVPGAKGVDRGRVKSIIS